jgi:hypothetical protein
MGTSSYCEITISINSRLLGIVFDLTWPGLEPTIYHTGGERTNLQPTIYHTGGERTNLQPTIYHTGGEHTNLHHQCGQKQENLVYTWKKVLQHPNFFSWQNCGMQVFYYWQKFTQNLNRMLQIESCMVDRGFEPRSGQIKDYQIGICCFSKKNKQTKACSIKEKEQRQVGLESG